MSMDDLMSDPESRMRRLALIERSLEHEARLFEPYGRPDISLFAKSLRDSDPGIRSMAVTVLSRVQDTRATQLLAEAMLEINGEITVQILEAFGKSTTEEATGALIKALRSPNPTITTHAALALGQKGRPEAVEPLISIIRQRSASPHRWSEGADGVLFTPPKPHPEDYSVGNSLITPYETREAARLLGKCKDHRAVEPLIQVVREHSKRTGNRDVLFLVRSLTSLGELGDQRALPAVIGAITDTDGDVRQAAAGVAARFAELRADPNISAMYFGAVQTLGSELAAEERDVRNHVLRALCILGDARALPQISAAVNNDPGLRTLLPIKEAIFQPNEVWRQFLLDQTIQVAARVKILTGLHNVLSGQPGVRLPMIVEVLFTTNWTEMYARGHLKDDIPESRACAQEIIDYLSLVRGSESQEDGPESGLLRAASGSQETDAPGILLRGSDRVATKDAPPNAWRSWPRRLIARFRR